MENGQFKFEGCSTPESGFAACGVDVLLRSVTVFAATTPSLRSCELGWGRPQKTLPREPN
jgi:hypothetical protein